MGTGVVSCELPCVVLFELFLLPIYLQVIICDASLVPTLLLFCFPFAPFYVSSTPGVKKKNYQLRGNLNKSKKVVPFSQLTLSVSVCVSRWLLSPYVDFRRWNGAFPVLEVSTFVLVKDRDSWPRF